MYCNILSIFFCLDNRIYFISLLKGEENTDKNEICSTPKSSIESTKNTVFGMRIFFLKICQVVASQVVVEQNRASIQLKISQNRGHEYPNPTKIRYDSGSLGLWGSFNHVYLSLISRTPD